MYRGDSNTLSFFSASPPPSFPYFRLAFALKGHEVLILFLFTHVVCHHVVWDLHLRYCTRVKNRSCTGISYALGSTFRALRFSFSLSIFSFLLARLLCEWGNLARFISLK